MAGLDQTGGGMALTGFTLNEIIEQYHQGIWQRGNRHAATWLFVYPLVGVVGMFKANYWLALLLHFSCYLLLLGTT